MEETESVGASSAAEEIKSEAVAFMASIEPEELQRCVFPERLDVLSDGGGVLGEFSLSVEFTRRALQPCMLLHAQSKGAIDGCPCGTTVTAYLTAELEVLEEDYHEFVKLHDHNVEKRCHMVQQNGWMVIDTCSRVGEEVTKGHMSYSMSALRGLVTEGSSMLLMRLIAQRKKVPENTVFIFLDQCSCINQTTFSQLGVKRVEVGDKVTEVFGVQRLVGSVEDSPSTWQCYFLDNGRLAIRKQVGSPVTIRLQQQGPKKFALVWEEDMQLYSQYLERKEELRAEYASYLREHPEIRTMLSRYLQDLLIVKPDNVCQFTRMHFESSTSRRSSDSKLKTTNST
ncbi:ciliogenesis-associated TTC17-interacting protein [Cyprinodon tularosa]|uniref:ciliogenesis-associated TTC17-interacting protein n=1 Tax=Cyprinodon tularosa TaxID=77115 RepID=UPI0018E25940|nr:ciliogenesis-associated TTC17-interacting protein [Cyprinodon tularosa]